MKIVATGLGVSAGRVTILDGIDLKFHPGQFIGILGPSGSGKSTLLTALSGRRPYSRGEISYNGQALEGRPGEVIGFVPQDDVLHMPLRVQRLLTYSARLQMPDRKRPELQKLVELTLRAVGLEERKNLPVKRLSGGQRKRVSIALELLFSPKALFLDEPTSGLDPELEKNIMMLCARLAKEGRLVAMTTHIMESVSMFDRLLVLVAGRLAFFGTPQEALTFFQVTDIQHIYPILASKEAGRLPERYRSTPFRRHYLQ